MKGTVLVFYLIDFGNLKTVECSICKQVGRWSLKADYHLIHDCNMCVYFLVDIF